MREITTASHESIPIRRQNAADFIGTVAMAVGAINILEDTFGGLNMPADARFGVSALVVGAGLKLVSRIFNRH